MTANDNIPDQRWLLVGDLPCLACEYNLRGLVGPVVKCPECGHANDLREPEPWRVKQLPVGVTQRQHWPAMTVLLSVSVVITGIVTVLNFASSRPNFIGFAITLVLFLGSVCVWLWEAKKWIKSCQDVGEAIRVLALLHLSTGLVFLGVLSLGMIFEFGWIALLMLFCFPIGATGMYWTSQLLARGETTGQYRQDWQN